MSTAFTPRKRQRLTFWRTTNEGLVPQDAWAKDAPFPVFVVAQDDETRRYVVHVTPRVLADFNAEVFEDGQATFWRIVVTEGGEVIGVAATWDPAAALASLVTLLAD